MEIARNILVATDFSVLGRDVVEYALGLANMFDATLNVVSVHVHHGALPPGSREARELREEMAELEAHLKPSGRLDQALIEFGDPAETIVRVARRLNADMIVMGSNNRHGFSRLAMGSTMPDVIRHAHVPVMIVKKAALRAAARADAEALR